MRDEDRYDAIVIGSGQGGTPLAVAFARSNRRTALVERGAVGGTCVNVGCTPTKTMYASAKIAALLGRAEQFGVHAENLRVELQKIRARKRTIVDQFRSGTESQLQETKNLELIRGEARFSGAHELQISGGREISAPWIFIDTGCRPKGLAIEGLDPARTLDSTSIMELDAPPKHLAVIGGGYIGLELGQMFARFGSTVTIVHRQAQLLNNEDEDVAAAISGFLREDGIEVILSAEVRRAQGSSLELATPGGSRTISADRVLFAAGRAPNTDQLSLERAGVELDQRGFVRTNDRLETNVPGVWAIGDVKGGPAFTHISYDDYRVLKTNLIDGGSATIKDRLVPYTVFIDPQLGRVGLTEKEAKARGLNHRVAKLEMAHVARAIESGETRGFIKAIVEQPSEKILGFAALGFEGGELMAMAELAMIGGLSAPRLGDAIFAHPTLAEAFNNLFA